MLDWSFTRGYSSDVGCFIDWENVRWSLANNQLPAADPERLSELARAVGRVSVLRAYGNFAHRDLRGHDHQLRGAGIAVVRTRQGENCAEGVMADDVARWSLSAPLDATALIVSGDEDVMPIVRFLQARLVRVLVVGVGATFSRRLAAAADVSLVWERDVVPVSLSLAGAAASISQPTSGDPC